MNEMIRSKIRYWFTHYFEIVAFSTGLILLAFMDPETVTGPNLCLFEQVGITFCPGNGLGHSIAYTFNGDFVNALQANLLGPFAIIMLSSRIGYLGYQKINNHDQ